eukprot:jgi/Ulvmu1/860/UM100_0011.1
MRSHIASMPSAVLVSSCSLRESVTDEGRAEVTHSLHCINSQQIYGELAIVACQSERVRDCLACLTCYWAGVSVRMTGKVAMRYQALNEPLQNYECGCCKA